MHVNLCLTYLTFHIVTSCEMKQPIIIARLSTM